MTRVLVIIAEWYNFKTTMRSFSANKFWVILVSLLAVGALTGLAMGLRSMSFRERQVFERNEAESAGLNPAEMIRTVVSVPFKTQLIFWVLVALMFALVAMLLTPEGRKRLLRLLVRAAVTFWVLYLLLTRYPEVLEWISLAFSPSGNGVTPAITNGGVPPPVFTPPSASSWTTYLISFGVAAFLTFLAWRLYGIWQKLNPADPELRARKLAGIVRASLQDLSSGRDSTDVILNCYYRMSDVVAEKKNLNRGASMTPHEFAARLEGAGLPGDAVQRLTGLFESVRYGRRRSDPKMVNEAVTCLTIILQYCGEPV